MNTTTWVTIGGLAVATFVVKGAGPVLLGGRTLPGLLAKIVPLLAPGLLGALVLVETFGGTGRSLTIDARAVGLAVAVIALWRRVPLIGAVLLAALATALVRLVS
jgi:branched-subunit amino acid transport protein